MSVVGDLVGIGQLVHPGGHFLAISRSDDRLLAVLEIVSPFSLVALDAVGDGESLLGHLSQDEGTTLAER